MKKGPFLRLISEEKSSFFMIFYLLLFKAIRQLKPYFFISTYEFVAVSVVVSTFLNS